MDRFGSPVRVQNAPKIEAWSLPRCSYDPVSVGGCFRSHFGLFLDPPEPRKSCSRVSGSTIFRKSGFRAERFKKMSKNASRTPPGGPNELQEQPKKRQEGPKTAPRIARNASRAPKSGPGGPQEGPGKPLEAPRRSQESPKVSQSHRGASQEASRSNKKTSKKPPPGNKHMSPEAASHKPTPLLAASPQAQAY